MNHVVISTSGRNLQGVIGRSAPARIPPFARNDNGCCFISQALLWFRKRVKLIAKLILPFSGGSRLFTAVQGNPSATDVKKPASFSPISVAPPTTMMAISDAISAYSMEVTPLSSSQKNLACMKSAFINVLVLKVLRKSSNRPVVISTNGGEILMAPSGQEERFLADARNDMFFQFLAGLSFLRTTDYSHLLTRCE